MAERLRIVAEHRAFQGFIIAVILFAGVLVGVETYPEIAERHGDLLHTLDGIVLGIFVLEIGIKMGAEGRRFWRYFRDPWNVFDFVIVAVCLVPGLAQYGMVMRMARLLRVFRLVRTIPRLQVLVAALLRSFPSMGYVGLLLFILFYMYAVAGVFLFRENDPVHFGNLQTALLTLFRTVTLEDWTNILYIQMYGCDVHPFGMQEALCTSPQPFPIAAPVYFVSFVLLGTMVVLNLFIGIIVNSFEGAHRETEMRQAGEPPSLSAEIDHLSADLAVLQERLQRLKHAADRGGRAA